MDDEKVGWQIGVVRYIVKSMVCDWRYGDAAKTRAGGGGFLKGYGRINR
jgi:hypothetical protein